MLSRRRLLHDEGGIVLDGSSVDFGGPCGSHEDDATMMMMMIALSSTTEIEWRHAVQKVLNNDNFRRDD